MACRRLRVVNTLITPGTDFTFVIEPTALTPGCQYELVVNMNWAEATGTEVIYISDGAATNRVLDGIADRLRVSEIRKCCPCNTVALRMVYGTDSADNVAHFQVRYPKTPGCVVPTFTATATA